LLLKDYKLSRRLSHLEQLFLRCPPDDVLLPISPDQGRRTGFPKRRAPLKIQMIDKVQEENCLIKPCTTVKAL